MQTLHTGNLIITLVFSLCCAYQLVYLLLPRVKKEKPLPPSGGKHDYAVLICARTEASFTSRAASPSSGAAV